jgi:AcrR family transcriptional regulator
MQRGASAVYRARAPFEEGETMARPPDPDLEDRILNAAGKLWRNGQGKALTMRAVARAARTNTPAVYRRFRSRDDILRSLLLRTRQEVSQKLRTASSVEEACERYLDFALSHPSEYELYFLHEHDLFFSARSKRGVTLNQTLKQKRPVVEFMKSKLAAQLGESPDDCTRLALALWAQLHGTAMLLIAKTILPQHAAEMCSICRTSIKTLLREARRFADQNRRE